MQIIIDIKVPFLILPNYHTVGSFILNLYHITLTDTYGFNMVLIIIICAERRKTSPS